MSGYDKAPDKMSGAVDKGLMEQIGLVPAGWLGQDWE